MGQFKLKIEELAQRHLKRHLQSGDKASIKKIEQIILELTHTPYTGTGRPEAFKIRTDWFLVAQDK